MLSFDAAAKAQACIDEEISRLAIITLSALQTQRNTIAPVSRLPIPVLVQIFICYAHDDDDALYSDERTPCFKVPRWVAVSYVCRYWRHVALTCPALWSNLFMVSPQWTEALLTRSLGLPLRVCVKSPGHEDGVVWDFMARLAAHAERLQGCCIRLERRCQWPDAARVFQTLSRAAPRLRTLKIMVEGPPECQVYEGIYSCMDETPQAADGHILFDGDTPLLRELELTNFGMPWCSPTLRGLTTLRLSHLAAPFQLTIPELMEVLGRMPDLERLHLENALRGNSLDAPCQYPGQLCLPSLARLFVVARLSEIASLLSCVEIPSTTQVSLGCYQEMPPSADDFIRLCALLTQWLRASTNEAAPTPVPPIRTLAIENWTDLMHFQIGTSDVDHAWLPIGDDADDHTLLRVEVDSWPPLGKRHNDMITHICQGLPLAHLGRIRLEDCRFSPAFWLDTFGHLPELHAITLIDRGFSDLLAVLADSVSSPCGPSLPPPPFLFPNTHSEGPPPLPPPRAVFAPALAQLVLEEIGFTDDWDGDDDVCSDKVTQLSRVLARRRLDTGRRALERLHIVRCAHVGVQDVGKLQAEVGRVDWDGIERLGWDEYD